MNNIIKNITCDKYELYNFKTRLTIYDKKYLVYLFKNKEVMNKLDTFLDKIFINEKMEFHEIPKIVSFVSKICIEYRYDYNINIINIIKIIMEIIIYITFEKKNNDIIILYDIIDTSIELLKINPYKYNFLNIINWCK